MPTLLQLASRAGIRGVDLEWLHALISDWQLLADLSFADLVLWAPLGSQQDSEDWPEDASWIALAQMRPTTAPTALPDDIVGTVRPSGPQPLLAAAFLDRRVCREGDPEWTRGVPVRHETIPVCRGDRVIAVIERSTNLSSARTPSRLDLAYLSAADDLTQMVAAGIFPAPGEEPALVRSPRVGDGMLRLSRSGKVTYASPNGLSAYRRLGLTADIVGKQLGPLTARLCAGERAPRDDSLMVAASGRSHAETEVEANGSVVQLRTIPLVVDGEPAGALILLRDVTELRHRERELLTKDATIREIHHRVKNNLQTVAALLRLQARRLRAPEARAALEEAVRRVGSIAMVHETLSHAPDEIVDFDDIAGRVAMMAGEVSAPEARVTPRLVGEFGLLPALVATPLALVLTELLQNAHQHGLSRTEDAAAGSLEVIALRGPGRLTVTVSDNGTGLPADFDLDSTPSLGLQIVRTLVLTELKGRLEIEPRAGGGTRVVVELPVGEPTLAENALAETGLGEPRPRPGGSVVEERDAAAL